MKRTPRFVFITSVIALLTLLMSSIVSAHTVTVNGAGADWFSKTQLPRTNAGHILRNASGQGEYAWSDVVGTATRVGDQRVDATTPFTRAVDLEQFRVTADATNLYFLAELEFIASTSNPVPSSKLPQLQIAIQTPSGTHLNTSLVSPNGSVPVDTTVSTDANWDFLVQTRFQASLSAPPALYTTPASSSNVGSATLTKSTGNTAEISIPWSELGGKPAKDKHLRFTLAVLFSDGTTPSDGATSKVMDAISSADDTLAEVQDGGIDTFFDVYFDTNGEPYSPLLVSEIVPRPNGSKGGQWVEIYNNSGAALNLNGFKFGDEANRGGNSSQDGMFQLPNISLPAGQVLIVTRNRSSFDALAYGTNTEPPMLPAGFNRIYTVDQSETGSTPSPLSPDNAWTGCTQAADCKFDLKIDPSIDPITQQPRPFSDEQLILDESDTIVDLVQYAVPGAATYPGVTSLPVPAAGVPNNASYQRTPADRDTNDHTLDFVVTSSYAEQTPGNANLASQTDLSLVKTGPTSQVENTQARYVLHYSNANPGAVGATGIVISDTLPAGVTYVSEDSSPVIQPSTVNGQTYTWTLPQLNAGATGLITITVQMPSLAAVPGGVITNTAEISIAPGGAISELDPSNNTAQLATTVTLTAQPDLGISKTLLNPGQAYPTGQAIYQVDYANSGDLDAATVTILDTIPPGLTYVSNTGGFPATPGTGTVLFNLGTQAAATSGTFNVIFNVNADARVGDPLTNTVTIATSTVPEFNPDNNTATSQPATIQPRPAIDLNITKTAGSTEAAAGGTIQYTIAVANNVAANTTATAVVVTDNLPPGLTYVPGSTTGGAGEPTIVGNTLTWNLPASFDLAPSPTAKSFSFQVTVSESAELGDTFSNTATVSGGGAVEPEAGLGDNTSTSGETTVTSVAPTEFKLYLPLVVK
jgi:uncharacterized repeat protein (TIGR01451 family)